MKEQTCSAVAEAQSKVNMKAEIKISQQNITQRIAIASLLPIVHPGASLLQVTHTSGVFKWDSNNKQKKHSNHEQLQKSVSFTIIIKLIRLINFTVLSFQWKMLQGAYRHTPPGWPLAGDAPRPHLAGQRRRSGRVSSTGDIC